MADDSTVAETETQQTALKLPLARIKRIAKTADEVKMLAQDSVVMLTKATELFIEYLAIESHKQTIAGKRKIIKYDDVSNAIDHNEALAFLKDAIPAKKKVN